VGDHTPVRLVLTRDAEQFAARAERFLAERVERNVLATVLLLARDREHAGPALAAGARQCMLFTDLANPTSNQIYAAVGYRRCGDWEEYAFIAP
jgi:hypothetical protein